MINHEKIRTQNFKVKLPDELLDLFIQNASEYFMALEKDLHKVSPIDSVDVISALTNFREYFNSESEWERLTLQSLDVLRKGVQGAFFDKIAAITGMTHVAFAVHVLSEQAPKVRPFLQSINDLLLSNVDDFLKKSNKKEFNMAGNYEIIKGLSGPLRYLINFNDDERMKDMAERVINVFIKRSKDITILGQRVTGWYYYLTKSEKSFMHEETFDRCVNYGVSHGMGSPLATLAMAYKAGFRVDGLMEAINGLVAEYMNAVCFVNYIAYWPGRIKLEQYIGSEEIPKIPNQMSWCYGSAGILRVMFLAGDLICDKDIKHFTLEEFSKIAKMDLSEYKFNQPIVCHGHIGTAAILNAMYLDTGREEFLEKTIEMIGVSLRYNIERYFENEVRVAKERNISSRASLHSHLEGYNGIIQTTLSILKGQPGADEKRLLIV